MVWINGCLALDDEMLNEIMDSIEINEIDLIGENSLSTFPRNAQILHVKNGPPSYIIMHDC